ncbi:MAG: DUF6624 domain-containing protein [Flexibacteraceae bacterium]
MVNILVTDIIGTMILLYGSFVIMKLRNALTGLLICFLAIGLNSVYAQRYTSNNPAYIKLVKKADSALEKSDFGKAVSLYTEALNISNKSVRTVSKAALANMKVGNLQVAITLLKQAHETDWKLACTYLGSHAADYTDLQNNPAFLGIFEDCEKKMAAYESEVDGVYQDSIQALYNRDQMHRATFESLALNHGYNSPQMQEAKQLQQAADALNQKILAELLQAKGFPTLTKVKRGATQTALSILQRADTSTINKWIPTIKKLITEKELLEADCAYIIDFALVQQGKPQIYGTQLYRDKADNLLKPRPFTSLSAVTQSRKLAGLPLWSEYLLQMGAEQPAPVKKTQATKKRSVKNAK